MAEENSSIIPVELRVQVRLPQDLQEEVLVRLPAKSLFRLKSVCTEWRSKFESHPFIALYGQRRPRGIYNSSLELQTMSLPNFIKMVSGLDLDHEDDETLKTNRLDGDRWARAFHVLGPLSNGIYCLTSHYMRSSDCSCSILSAKIALCNPATHQYKFADPFPRRFRPVLSKIFSSPCRLHYGFGSVQTGTEYKINSSSSEPTLDYRIVVIIHYGHKMPFPFLVFAYSFQRCKWEKIVDYEAGKRKVGEPKATDAFDLQEERRITGIYNPLERCPQGFLNGCFHWAVTHPGPSISVLAYNFADQSFKLLDGPPNHMDYVTDERVVHMGGAFVMHGHLAFIRCFNVRPRPTSDPRALQTVEIGIWMMLEYGVKGSWTRIYTINPDFKGLFNRLDGIDYEEDPCADGGIRIKGLILKVGRDDNKQHEIISCGEGGRHQVIRSAGAHEPISIEKPADEVVTIIDAPTENIVCWNTPGISTYIETLERL